MVASRWQKHRRALQMIPIEGMVQRVDLESVDELFRRLEPGSESLPEKSRTTSWLFRGQSKP